MGVVTHVVFVFCATNILRTSASARVDSRIRAYASVLCTRIEFIDVQAQLYKLITKLRPELYFWLKCVLWPRFCVDMLHNA